MATLVPVLREETWRALRAADGPVVLFKHSTACSQSAAAYRVLRAWCERQGAAAPLLALVRVREERALSQRIAQETGVRHQSPQVIVLRGGRAAAVLSHGDIRPESLSRALAAGTTA